MKKSIKKTMIVILIVIVALLCVVNLGLALLWANRSTLTVGTYVKTNGGSNIIIMNDGPCLLHTENENIFSDLQTGAKILIVNNNDNAEITTPRATDCYFCLCLGKGDLSDIPEEHLEGLKYFGYTP